MIQHLSYYCFHYAEQQGWSFDISKKRHRRAQKLVGGQNWGGEGQRKAALPVQEAERGQTLLGLTFFRLLSSSSSWRIRTSLVDSSSFSRRSSSCCRKNIRRSCAEGKQELVHVNKYSSTWIRDIWRMYSLFFTHSIDHVDPINRPLPVQLTRSSFVFFAYWIWIYGSCTSSSWLGQ